MITHTLQSEHVYTVSRLNNEVRLLLEHDFPLVWVEGEVSNFSAPHSGHWYFSLKDAHAQIPCAMFKNSQRKLNFTPKDGMHILVKGRVTLYENTGRYQIIAEDLEELGEGRLRRAFEALKKKLATAGLFDRERKKPLPQFPKCIGVITSATGAAIRDILNVLGRRFGCVPVIIYPTLVQGAQAAATIAQAIQLANQRNECDVLILARGGGSLEDLWPFNEEPVAYAIFNSQIPIISGVGHEVDFTISDFVADVRAPTPSAAAEIAVPDCTELLQLVLRHEQYIVRQVQSKVAHLKQHISWAHKHLAQHHPSKQLAVKMQRLDFHELTLMQLQTKLLHQVTRRLNDLNTQLQAQLPVHRINALQHQLVLKLHALKQSVAKTVQDKQALLANLSATLDALSPLATLSRGYAIVTKNEKIVTTTAGLHAGDKLGVKLREGLIESVVTGIKES